VYAAGLILFELCCIFSTQHERSERILKLRNERKIPKDLKCKYSIESDLIMQMTDPKPEKRPTASELLKSEKLKHWALDVKYE